MTPVGSTTVEQIDKSVLVCEDQTNLAGMNDCPRSVPFTVFSHTLLRMINHFRRFMFDFRERVKLCLIKDMHGEEIREESNFTSRGPLFSRFPLQMELMIVLLWLGSVHLHWISSLIIF
jgi:hypothetical protein